MTRQVAGFTYKDPFLEGLNSYEILCTRWTQAHTHTHTPAPTIIVCLSFWYIHLMRMESIVLHGLCVTTNALQEQLGTASALRNVLLMPFKTLFVTCYQRTALAPDSI